ncbi:MAG: LamG domain-containing protein, partial [Patescibacteria group bacterium]|nr:LamG domain-containing protein [Patescibacteria group bacterium]
IFFNILNTGKVQLDTESSSTLGHVLASSADPLSAGQWYQVAGVARASNLQVYVDEQAGTPTNYSGLYPLVTGDNSYYGKRMNVGAWTYSSPTPSSVFNGLIDDVRVYNRALTTAQIQAMYNAGRLR